MVTRLAAVVLAALAAAEDVTRLPFRCATHNKRPELCARAWVWKQGPCVYRRAEERCRSEAFWKAGLETSRSHRNASTIGMKREQTKSLPRADCRMRPPEDISVRVGTRPRVAAPWGPSNFTRSSMQRWPQGEDRAWWARVIHASQHPAACGRYLLVTNDLVGAGLGMTARLLEVLLLTAVQRRRVLLEVPLQTGEVGRWCDRPPYTLACFFRPWTHCPRPADGSPVLKGSPWGHLLRDKRFKAASNADSPNDSISISLSYVKGKYAPACVPRRA